MLHYAWSEILKVFDIIYFNSKDGKLFLKMCKYAHNIAEDVIAKRREAMVIILYILHICVHLCYFSV